MCRMKTLWITFFLSVIIFEISIAQSAGSNQSITWNNKELIYDSLLSSNQVFYFDEQSGTDLTTGLPYILLNYKLDHSPNIENINVILSANQTTEFSELERQYLKENKHSFPSIIKKRIVTIRKVPFLELQIFPFQNNENAELTNKITEFTVSLEIPEHYHPVLKASINESPKNSVLSSGKWVKIKIDETGVYKIPYSKLASWGFSKTESVNLFGNGGTMLPKSNSEARLNDLEENAILHHNDAIFFYAQGSVNWSYDPFKDLFIHQLHDYSDETYYYLTEDIGVGKRIETDDSEYPNYTHQADDFDSYAFHELEENNLLKSGRTWYGKQFKDPNLSRNYSFAFENIDLTEPVKIYTDVIAASNISSRFEVFVNNSSTALQSIHIPSVDYSDYTGSFAKAGIAQSEFYADSKDLNIRLEYNGPSSSRGGWLNFICLNAKEKLTLENESFLTFRNKDITATENITKFTIKNTTSSTKVWDVTQHTNPIEQKIISTENSTFFTTSTGVLKEFVAVNLNANFNEPSFVEHVANQNLYGLDVPDMLIITHPDFLIEANRLANLHQEHSGLSSKVVLPEQIYNEFSSGKPDVSSIRDFVKYMYDKDLKLKYLLLFGDGSYDNRSQDSDNTNKILTYQSVNSIVIKDSYTSDDFYGFLDENEGENIQFNKLDIGIGRLCVNTQKEANDVVNKIESYLYDQNNSIWRTKATFIGDDGDGNVHMRDADRLTQKVNKDHPEFNLTKIYLDAYQKTMVTGGARYPEVNTAIGNAIAEGTLIFNYTGHGGESGLASEKIVTIPDIKGWSNYNRLPLFVTATCEFSRYDDRHATSAGEHVLLNPIGGGIALLTTTRIAWSNQNYDINSNLYKYIFEKDSNGEKLRLGDIIRLTKVASNSNINKLNFTLLGDPALRLNYPNNKIITTAINESNNTAAWDTINALSHVSIKGKVMIPEQSGLMFENGTASVKVFDKPVTIQTLGNGGNTPFEYESYENRIFTGDVVLEDNTFQVDFIVPKDIRYNIDYGKISFYGIDSDNNDAFGANTSVLIGGMTNNPPIDNDGPTIKAKVNNTNYINGINTGSNPFLTLDLFDDNGINTSGAGIGHDITLVINDDRSNTLVLNGYYSASTGSYQQGILNYQLNNLEEGTHTITIKAWDNLNNSSSIDLNIEVVNTGNLAIKNSFLSPNPITPGQTLTIGFEHDAPNELIQVKLSLFTIDGQLIDVHEKSVPSSGFAVNPFSYPIPGSLGQGLYLLNCECQTNGNQTAHFSKKIIILK